MKKLLLSVILLCYLAFSCGVMVNLHYCMDKLASAQLFSGAGTECGKCGMHMDEAHGCCRDEVTVVKMDDDQHPVVATDFSIPSLEAIASVPSPFLSASFYNYNEPQPDHHHSPPVVASQPIYLQVGVFRI